MRRLALFCALAAPVLYSQEETPDHRLRTSGAVFHEIMSAPDGGIPHDLLDKAQCVVIVPELKKAAFVIGGEYGNPYRGDNQGFEANKAAVPPTGTPVRLILRRAT